MRNKRGKQQVSRVFLLNTITCIIKLKFMLCFWLYFAHDFIILYFCLFCVREKLKVNFSVEITAKFERKHASMCFLTALRSRLMVITAEQKRIKRESKQTREI